MMEQYLEGLRRNLKKEGFVYLRVKAIPGSAKTELAELLNGEEPTLKVRIAAPPEKNKANKACIKFFSELFDAPCEIVSGGTAKVKLLKVFRRR